jgi:hypothetical protein
VFDSAALRARLGGVRDRIARATGRAGRDPASVRLIAVSKTFSADHVRAAADFGQVDFGENKVQEALPKMDAIPDLQLSWHLIGHLQSNKARRAGARFDAIHSVDGSDLVARVDEAALAAGRRIDLLVQVDLAGEATKHGASRGALLPLLQAGANCRAARIVGLMVLPPAVAEPEAARPYFRSLVALRDELVQHGVDPVALAELSMGMSHDFEVAIEEGATMVRVGSAIFGERSYV